MADYSQYGLGRVPSPDARDLKFSMRRILPSSIEVVSRFYETGPVLNQQSTPHCVGYAWRQFLTSEPTITVDGPTADEIYHAAQLEDEWAGEDYDGTSVRGGAVVMTNQQRLKSYVWAANEIDIRDFLITTGTVVMGTNWFMNMFDPLPDGTLKVSGSLAGGHAYLLCGYDAARNAVKMIQSWGEAWGPLHGFAYIRMKDLARLMRAGGEACAAVELDLTPVAPTFDELAATISNLSKRVASIEQRIGKG